MRLGVVDLIGSTRRVVLVRDLPTEEPQHQVDFRWPALGEKDEFDRAVDAGVVLGDVERPPEAFVELLFISAEHGEDCLLRRLRSLSRPGVAVVVAVDEGDNARIHHTLAVRQAQLVVHNRHQAVFRPGVVGRSISVMGDVVEPDGVNAGLSNEHLSHLGGDAPSGLLVLGVHDIPFDSGGASTCLVLTELL